MKDERLTPTYTNSARPSRLSAYSARYFDFLDPSHSVFSRTNYYDDLKDIHPWLRRPCSRNSGIPLTTLLAGPCPIRVEALAQPRIKREKLIRQEFFDNFTNYAYSGVPHRALSAGCSKRLDQLARPKTAPFRDEKPLELPRSVSRSALQARTTPRIENLSKPKYDLDTFKKQSWNNDKKTS